MKNSIKTGLLFIFTLLFITCTNNFEDLNRNPAAPPLSSDDSNNGGPPDYSLVCGLGSLFSMNPLDAVPLTEDEENPGNFIFEGNIIKGSGNKMFKFCLGKGEWDKIYYLIPENIDFDGVKLFTVGENSMKLCSDKTGNYLDHYWGISDGEDAYYRLTVNPIELVLNVEKLGPVVDEDINYDDINITYQISDEELKALKANESTISLVFRSFSYEGLYNDYQRTTNLTHDIYAGYFANNHPGFISNSPNYVYTENWSGKRWEHFYVDRTKEYASLIRTFWFIDKEKYNNAFYISRIYYAFLASTMTDTYGDMPFSVVVKGLAAPQKATYDTQEKIYDMIFKLLEQAVDNIEIGNGSYNFGDDDRCFGGDEEKWVRFANTLRLRLALRLSNIAPEKAKKEGEKALRHPGGLMRSNDDNMKIVPKYAPAEMGGENSGGDENIYALVSFAWVDACMSKDIEIFYKNQSADIDPRCLVQWYRPTPKPLLMGGIEFENDFNGCVIGNDNVEQSSENYSIIRSNTSSMNAKDLYDTHWFGNSREVVWMSYSESLFLLAEAALRGWAGISQSAQDYFEDGIRASMQYYRINDSQINNYINNMNIFTATNNPFNGTDKEAVLEQIITQKWLAVFPNGNEGWAEFRRTDYPALNTHWNSKDPNIPNGKFIKRIGYPGSEYDYNYENVPLNVHQGSRVWWDVEDTNSSSGERIKPNNFRSGLKRILF